MADSDKEGEGGSEGMGRGLVLGFGTGERLPGGDEGVRGVR